MHFLHCPKAHDINAAKDQTHNCTYEREECRSTCKWVIFSKLNLENCKDSTAYKMSVPDQNAEVTGKLEKCTYVSSRTETMFNVFHSVSSESTKSSHECLNARRRGEIPVQGEGPNACD
jgi:hypothetical protein